MREQILEYLLSQRDNDNWKINDFLITLTNNKHLQDLAEVLVKMENTSLITLRGQGNDLGKNGKDLYNTDVEAKIKNDGVAEILSLKRLKTQEEAIISQSNSTISTNEALRAGTTSTIDLNTETKKYYNKQKNTGYAIAFFTAVTMLTGVATFFKGCVNNEDCRQSELQELRSKQLVLDRTLKSHIMTDSLRELKEKKNASVSPVDSSK